MELCASPRKNVVMAPKTLRSFVKYRREDCQNEVKKSQRVANLQFVHGDRFIPKRYNSDNMLYNRNYLSSNEEKDILKTNFAMTCKCWLQTNLGDAINNSFGLRSSRLLQFSNLTSHQCEINRRKNIDGDWPCVPRPRPLAYVHATHEMPDLCASFNHNLMDWSSNGQMAISFGHDMVVWHNEAETTMCYGIKHPGALKYSPNGKYLALGSIEFDYPVLELWELQSPEEFQVTNGKYLHKWKKSISCIEWSADSKQIVCGTGCGLILVLSVLTLRTLQKIRKHHHQIQSMRYSPNGLYLATTDVKGYISVFQTHQYKSLMCMRSNCVDVTFDWHPWSGVHLAVAEKSPPSICIYHVPRQEMVAFYQRTNKKIQIESITYSKITGELLVNIFRHDKNGCPCCEILVLSSLNRVVDIVGHQERNVLFMMWSPDGSKLAAVGLDDSFSIWNFYPKEKMTAKKVKNNSNNNNVKQKRSCLELYSLIK